MFTLCHEQAVYFHCTQKLVPQCQGQYLSLLRLLPKRFELDSQKRQQNSAQQQYSQYICRRRGPKRLPKCHGVEVFLGPLSGKPRDGSPLAKLYFKSTSIPQSCAPRFRRVSCTVVWLTLQWKVHYLMCVLIESSVELFLSNNDKMQVIFGYLLGVQTVHEVFIVFSLKQVAWTFFG